MTSILLVFLLLYGVTYAANELLFLDVPKGIWYENAVDKVSSENIMAGDKNKFRPNDNVTRAELAQTISNTLKVINKNNIDNQLDNMVINTITNTLPSVVLIKTDNLFGSGVIIDKNHILTALHVVKETIKGDTSQNTNFKIYFYNNSIKYTGVVEKSSVESDLALIYIKDYTMAPPFIKLAESIQVGETVLTFGNPRAFSFSVSKGIISNINVTVKNAISQFTQFDAPISGGSSGGALCNSKGELIGIVNSKVNEIDTEGLGFCSFKRVY